MSRVFIEDIGEVVERKGKVVVWRVLVSNNYFPEEMYLVESPAGERLVLGRGIWGRRKFELIQEIADILFEAVLGKMNFSQSPRQFLILRGAYPFDLQRVSRRLIPEFILPTTFLKLQRKLIDGNWQIEEKFFLGKWTGDLWLIPDTAIASGSTITYLLTKGLKVAKPKRIIVFTAAGSIEGIIKIWHTCQEHDVEMIPVFSQCIFEVSEKGVLPNLPYTDLPVENPGTIVSREFYQKAHQVYQGKPMCCVGDVGDSLENPEKYIAETLEEIKILGIDISQPGWEWVQALMKGGRNANSCYSVREGRKVF